jgi:DNA-binding response OmpR family regulator
MGQAYLAGYSILVVEDEPLIALDLRRIVESTGAHVFAATQPQHALLLADHPDVSAAVLDYRMGHEDIGPLCARLQERTIPFIFYTGYEDVHERWPDAIVVSKPSTEDTILAALNAVLGRSHTHIGPSPKHEGLPA